MNKKEINQALEKFSKEFRAKIEEHFSTNHDVHVKLENLNFSISKKKNKEFAMEMDNSPLSSRCHFNEQGQVVCD
ncbi:MAG: hypothetical protein ABI402_17485 [Ferruginibacter sp.]